MHFIHRFLATTDRATAEDLAQDVFLSAWKYAPTFEPRAKVVTWLFRIATNACLNYRRYRRVRSNAARQHEVPEARRAGASVEAGAPNGVADRADEVRAAIAALPATQRAAIVLRYFHEFSYTEIAETMSTTASAVDSLLHRARRSLQTRLGPKKSADSPQIRWT
jgi:RNA polymerase sigma-70 factor (ECF subfamily)